MSGISLEPADLGRDLLTDLALCNSAHPGPWIQVGYASGVIVSEMSQGQDIAVFSMWTEEECQTVQATKSPHQENATLFVASREGWPAAIRRALVAEEEVRRQREIIDGLRQKIQNLVGVYL